MEFPITTEKQVEIARLGKESKYNYEIVWGNPMTGKEYGKLTVNYPKINGVSFASEYIQLSQHNREITIEKSGNIIIKEE